MKPFKPQRRDIQYGPAPKHLVEAVRKELRRLVEQPDLDAHLGMIGRLANQADDMLMCIKSPEAVMRDEHGVEVPGIVSTANNVETYGAAILRQLIPALSGYQKAQQESPESLVHAITTARRAGMTDVAAELEKKLCGKALDGKRPISSPFATVDDYLPPLPVATLPKADNEPKTKKNGKDSDTWFIDPMNSSGRASDDNDGRTALTPVLTHSALTARWPVDSHDRRVIVVSNGPKKKSKKNGRAEVTT